jgi:hypothetical protein
MTWFIWLEPIIYLVMLGFGLRWFVRFMLEVRRHQQLMHRMEQYRTWLHVVKARGPTPDELEYMKRIMTADDTDDYRGPWEKVIDV